MIQHSVLLSSWEASLDRCTPTRKLSCTTAGLSPCTSTWLKENDSNSLNLKSRRKAMKKEKLKLSSQSRFTFPLHWKVQGVIQGILLLPPESSKAR